MASRFLYTNFTWLAKPVFELVLRSRLAKGKEDPKRINERRGRPSLARPHGPLYWFHAASVGEGMAVVPVVQALIDADDSAHVMVTSGTMTSARILSEVLPQRCFHQYVPLDRQDWVDSFLNHWMPDAAIWVESELWPNLVMRTKAKGVPMALLNARLSKRSAQRWQRFGGNFARQLFGCFDTILTQDDDNKQRLESLGLAQVEAAANLKKLFGFSRKLSVADKAKFDAIKSRPLRWMAASTHPGEEVLAIEASNLLQVKQPDFVTILVPRHPERIDEIEGLIADQGRDSVRFSQYQPGQTLDVVIIDTIGLLARLYEIAPVSFIGGSMNLGLGGHNLFEAIRARSVIIHGPDMANFQEVTEKLNTLQAAIEISSVEELQQALEELCNDRDKRLAMVDSAQTLADQDTKSRDFVIATVQRLLSPQSMTPNAEG